MKMMVIPIVADALKTVTNSLDRGGGWKNWKSEKESRYLDNGVVVIREESWRPVKTCNHSASSERLPANADVRQLARSTIIIIPKDDIDYTKKRRG